MDPLALRWRRPPRWRLAPPCARTVYEATLRERYARAIRNGQDPGLALYTVARESLRAENKQRPKRDEVYRRIELLLCTGAVHFSTKCSPVET